MEIDTMGTYNMCHAVYPAMAKNNNEGGSGNGGVIINISMTLHYGATWYQAHASAAKSAIDSLTRTLALEWGIDGIRVNGSKCFLIGQFFFDFIFCRFLCFSQIDLV